MGPKWMKYTAKFKLAVVADANKTNNSAAARKYEINGKLVHDWKKNIHVLEKLSHNKCADSKACF